MVASHFNGQNENTTVKILRHENRYYKSLTIQQSSGKVRYDLKEISPNEVSDIRRKYSENNNGALLMVINADEDPKAAQIIEDNLGTLRLDGSTAYEYKGDYYIFLPEDPPIKFSSNDFPAEKALFEKNFKRPLKVQHVSSETPLGDAIEKAIREHPPETQPSLAPTEQAPPKRRPPPPDDPDDFRMG